MSLMIPPRLVHNGRRWASIAAAAVVGLVVLKKVAGCIATTRKEAAAKKRHAAQKPNVVYLFAFPQHPTLGCVSAPCLKVETFLKLFKIPYEIVSTMDTKVSPTGRFPCAEINGACIADSAFIIKACMERFNVPETLTPSQVANGVALTRLLEDSLRLGFYRWNMVDNCEVMVRRFTVMLGYPQVAVAMAIKQMRKQLITTLNLHGHGDLTDEQYQQVLLEDVQAVEDFLTRSTFAVSDSPSRFDGAAYAWCKQLLLPDVPRDGCPAAAYAASSTTIAAYVARVEAAMAAPKAAAQPEVEHHQ